MPLQSSFNHFLRDAQAGRLKTALLALLFMVGMYFWIPPFYRAIAGKEPVPVQTEMTLEPTQRPQVVAETSFAIRATQADRAQSSASSWENSQDQRVTDPLVQSVEVAAIRSDPFRIDHEQFPSQVLFSKNPNENVEIKKRNPIDPSAAQAGLTLKSTIVGVKRRAAYINRKLYFEGAEIEEGGKTYRLAEVYPRKVVLKHGSETIELEIAESTSSKK